MAGANYGPTFIETFGTTSPVTGDIPSSVTDGQPLSGLSAIMPIVSAPEGAHLDGSGQLVAYLLDASFGLPLVSAAVDGDPAMLLAYDAQTVNFVEAQVVHGVTSQASGTVASDSDSGTSGTLTLTDVASTFVDNEVLGVTYATSSAVSSANSFLAYDGGSVAFEVDEVVTGGTSNATATVVAVVGDETSGVLELTDVDGTFQNNEVLTGDGSGAAVADLVVYRTLEYEAQTTAFIAAQVVYGLNSGATGTIQTDTDDGDTGTLDLKLVTGTFEAGEPIAVAFALANGSEYQTLDFENSTGTIEVGAIVTGRTSTASGQVTVNDGDTLTIINTGPTLFLDEELLAVNPLRWAPYPAANYDVNGNGRDQAFAALQIFAPRRQARIKWIPVEVGFDTGSTGITVRQCGFAPNSSFIPSPDHP